MDWFVTWWMIYLVCLQGGRLIDVVRCDHCMNRRYLGNFPKMWLCTAGSSITRGWERKKKCKKDIVEDYYSYLLLVGSKTYSAMKMFSETPYKNPGYM